MLYRDKKGRLRNDSRPRWFEPFSVRTAMGVEISPEELHQISKKNIRWMEQPSSLIAHPYIEYQNDPTYSRPFKPEKGR